MQRDNYTITKRPVRLLVVGSMNMDLCIYGLQGLPAWGTSTFATQYRYAAGGKGANQAFACARLGADSCMVGRVGKDDNGEKLLASLREGEVRTEFVVQDLVLSTGFSTMNMGPDGTYFSIYVPGANDALCYDDLSQALAAFKPDMIVMQLEMPRELIGQICDLGRTTKIPVFLDAGPAQSIPLETLRGAFIISPNEAETLALTGIDPADETRMRKAAAMIFEGAKPSYVLLKLGGRGAYLYGEGVEELIPGFRVDAVDTTAAGDTFGAAFCVRYCQGASLADAVRFGHAAAAICVTRKGGQPSVPTLEETMTFYEQHKTEG